MSVVPYGLPPFFPVTYPESALSPGIPGTAMPAVASPAGNRKDFTTNTIEFSLELAYDAFMAPLFWLLRNWAAVMPETMFAGTVLAVALLFYWNFSLEDD